MRATGLLLMTVQSCMVLAGGRLACGQETASPADANSTQQQVRQAVELGLTFLEKDAAKWRQEHSCSTCHHGTMTAWVYAEAARHGYKLAPETVTSTNDWAKERLERINLPRDERPGWNMVNSPALYMAVMAQAVPGQTVVSSDQLRQISDHLVRHQETDGSWAWSLAPAKNRPPPFFESDEVATRLAYMALAPHIRDASGVDAPVVNARAKAANWLKTSKPTGTTQAAVLELLMRFRDAAPAEQLQPDIEQFLKRQNEDGGWGQLDDVPSDAYATGQSLYVLSLLGVNRGRPEIQRSIAFLIAGQQADGSWPMARRGHPGVTPTNQTIPIVYFGSAWATLGLIRSGS